MERNLNDKQLREKLQSAEYSFDPKAWEQMDAMLDSKSKTKIVPWWWSAAALLVISIGVAVCTYRGTEQSPALISAGIKTSSPKIDNTTQQTTTGKVSTSISTSEMVSAPSETRTNTDPIISTHSDSKRDQRSAYSPLQVAAVDDNNHDKIAHTDAPTDTRADKESNTKRSPAPESININTLKAEEIALSTAGSLSLASTPESGSETIPSAHFKHKTPIKYSLGIVGNLSEGFISKTYSDKPSWSLGLCEELRVGKYLGITTGLLYSESNFMINKPKYPSDALIYPTRYESHIRQVNIPLGAKLYPYSHRNLRLSIGAAYVSHIKLKESFSYQLQQFPSQTVSIYDPYYSIVPPSSSRNPNQTPVSKSATDYFSLANGHTYYGSVAVTMGIDYSISKHFVLSAEPALDISLAKVVKQDVHLYSPGLNVSFKYGF